MVKDKNKDIYLSVTIPAYNEKDVIEKTLYDIDAYLKEQSYSSEILVVNDGSTDGTQEIVKNLTKEIENLKLINCKINKGKGRAVWEAVLQAEGKFRLFMDADSSTAIDQIGAIIEYCEDGYEVVIGSREVDGALIKRHQPLVREKLGRFFNLLVRNIFGLPIKDTQAGFKLFSAPAVERIFPLQTIWGWVFDVELLVLAQHFGFKIKEVPIVWSHYPNSRVSVLGDMVITLLDILKIKMNLISGFYESKAKVAEAQKKI